MRATELQWGLVPCNRDVNINDENQFLPQQVDIDSRNIIATHNGKEIRMNNIFH